jgi:hypothetical protein
MPQQRRFTAKFKTEIVLDLLTGPKTTAPLCRNHDLSFRSFDAGKPTFSSAPSPCLASIPTDSSTSTELSN